MTTHVRSYTCTCDKSNISECRSLTLLFR